MPVVKRLDGTVIVEYHDDIGLDRAISQPRLRKCLQNADLRGADLKGVDLEGADLTGADLREANLDNAILQGAVLNGANCEDAILTDIDFQDVDIARTNFRKANLLGTFVYNTDVSTAIWDHALVDADLKEQIMRWHEHKPEQYDRRIY